MAQRDWLKRQHPIYEARRAEWERNERRYRGGTHVISELRRFDWETCSTALPEGERAAQEALANRTVLAQMAGQPGEHYTDRQNQATYLNFPEAFMTMLRGHLFRKRPSADSGGLSFGTLGEVRKDRKGDAPTNAELVYFNVDGVGNDGAQWDAWWSDVTSWAGVTGHRWCFVESTTRPAVTSADVQAGARPYLVHHSPLEITNWDYVEGRLAWALLQLPPRPARIVNGDIVREQKGPMRLYVRKGFTGLDEGDETGLKFSAGGWWTFDDEGKQLTGEGDTGTWDKTRGEIPLWPHFYQRDKDNMSRSAVTEIANAAVAYMNLDSAANYDAWDAASSLQFLLGVDPDSFKVAVDKMMAGSKLIPVPIVRTDLGGTAAVVPSVQDSSAGAVTAEVFTKRLQAIRESVKEITSLEVSGVPDASGVSKQAGFGESKAPRLGLLASEVETSQNIALMFLELRFGSTKPSASVQWTRDFELAPLMDSIERLFDLQNASKISSATLSARAMTVAAKESGMLTTDEDEATVEGEFAESARALAASTLQIAGLTSEFGRDGVPTDPSAAPADPSATPPKAPDQIIQTTTDSVLNGAQISAAVDIVKSVADGELPLDAGLGMIQAFFNLSEEKAKAIMGSAGSDKFKPAPKPTAPAVPPVVPGATA